MSVKNDRLSSVESLLMSPAEPHTGISLPGLERGLFFRSFTQQGIICKNKCDILATSNPPVKIQNIERA